MKMISRHIGKIVMSKQETITLNSCFRKKSWVLLTVSAALLFLVSCASVSAPPPPEESAMSTYQEGVPGGAMVNTVEMSARVTAIDHFNREATLLGSDGEEVTVKVGPEAVHFDQIQKGDLVKVTVVEELVVYLDEENETSIGGSAAVVGLGAQAGGFAAETREIIGTVTAIDREKRTATLRFQDGSTKTFPVRSDIDLNKHKLGEQVVFHITEMVAIRIEKP
jgi:hypothetical protein